jgi:hypothetical protein
MRIVHPVAGEIEFDTLRDVIVRGKRAGWASGREPNNLPNGVKNYSYVDSEARLGYKDNFRGEQGFIGQEVVETMEGIPIWGMNYDDVFRVPDEFTPDMAKGFRKEAFSFLKQKLMQVPTEFPFRGPLGQSDLVNTSFGIIMYEHWISNCGSPDEALRECGGEEDIHLFHSNGTVRATPFQFSYRARLLVPDAYVVK